jgi:hypothetical protein
MKEETTRDKLRRLQEEICVKRISFSRKVTGIPRGNGDHIVTYDVEFPEGMSLSEVRVRAALVGLEVDRTAHQNAAAGGVIGKNQRDNALRAIRRGYGALLASMVTGEEEGDNEERQ